jgi:hypothetical protein
VQPIHPQVGSPLHYPPTCEVMEWELKVKERAKGQGERDSQQSSNWYEAAFSLYKNLPCYFTYC